MAIPIGTIVRTGVVIGVVTYCVWLGGDFGSGSAEAPKPARPLEIAEALLAPTIQPQPNRNPFRDAGAPPYKREEAEQSAGAAQRGGAKTAAAKGPSQDAKEAPPKPDGVDPLAGLMLNATSVGSNYRLAIINGRLYERGQPLKLPEPLTLQLVVEDVLPHKVFLRCDGKRLELTYSNKSKPAQ